MVARVARDWEQLTHWLHPTQTVGDAVAEEWIEREAERLRPKHVRLKVRRRRDGRIALFSKGLAVEDQGGRPGIPGLRVYQDLEATIPASVPRPHGPNRKHGMIRAWRLGYLAATLGLPRRSCPYPIAGQGSALRRAWEAGYETQHQGTRAN